MTAPALPGAAPDPARLPPEVERLLQAALLDAYAHGWAVGNSTTITANNDSEAALRTAIARALGGDGEPVACRVVGTTDAARAIGSLMDAWDLSDEDSVVEKLRGPMKAIRKLIDADALYTRPAATGAEVERAVAEEREACARIVRAFREQSEPGDDVRLTLEQAEQDIRARGVAKPRTGSEAPSASDEGAKS